MINSSFSSSKAKDAVNNVNSKQTKEASGSSFYDQAMREMDLFTDYITGGFYARSNFKKNIFKLSSNEQ